MMEEPVSRERSEADRLIESHLKDLRSYGLQGLEGRIQRGLDPAGMLAVKETRSKIQALTEKLHASLESLEELTKSLHVGAVWNRAQDLARAEKMEVRLWMLLAYACHEVNDHDLTSSEYLEDCARIEGVLNGALLDSEHVIEEAIQYLHTKAQTSFVKKDEVAFSEDDAFLFMAIAGETQGVCKAGDLYFVGANQLDFSVLANEGLVPVEREDRGRIVTFYQKDGVDRVKKLYPGLAIVFGDESLAIRFAKSAEHAKK